MPTVELLHRGRFRPIPGATATLIAANAWEIRLPRTEDLRKLGRRELEPEAWDEAVFSIDGVQTEPALGTGADPAWLVLTALVLT